jgi:hypothetical protein
MASHTKFLTVPSRAGRSLATSSPPHRQPFLAIKALGPLAVHNEPFPAQQHMQAPVAKPAPLRRQLAQASPQSFVT